MKSGVEHGVGVVHVTVDDAMTARLEDLVAHPVYSTFWLSYHAELAARRAIQPYFEEGENAVGAYLEIRHHAMAGVGAHVEIRATVIEVKGRFIRCRVEARHQTTKALLAEGLQDQIVLSTEVLDEKIASALR